MNAGENLSFLYYQLSIINFSFFVSGILSFFSIIAPARRRAGRPVCRQAGSCMATILFNSGTIIGYTLSLVLNLILLSFSARRRTVLHNNNKHLIFQFIFSI